MTRYLALAAVLMALLGAAYGRGWQDRGAREDVRAAGLIAERQRAAARVVGMAEALARTRGEREALALRLEAAAQADPGAARLVLSPLAADRVLQR